MGSNLVRLAVAACLAFGLFDAAVANDATTPASIPRPASTPAPVPAPAPAPAVAATSASPPANPVVGHTAPPAPSDAAASPTPIVTSTAPTLALAATFGAGATIRGGLHWRIFAAGVDAGEDRKMVAESSEASPLLQLPQGDYVVHVAYGLAGASRAVSVPSAGASSERIPLTAGALRVMGMLGTSKIPPDRLSIDVYVPQPGNSEAKIVVKNAHAGDAIGLPEGKYHIVTTYLDTVGVGSLNVPAHGTPTNSIVSVDLAVQTGKLTDVTVRHRAAFLTLKLVKTPGGEALANTEFTVLTPGGDVIRELIGAFPSLVLAEGDYVAIARRDGKTFQAEFSVQPSVDRDVEVIAK
jgi:hypothetical protein